MAKKLRYSTSMFIGETTHGIPMPVFFDTHTPIFNGRPPGIVITGQPGSGKTFFALTLTTLSVLTGKTTIVLDPKGDFLSLINLKDDIGEFSLWNLSDNGKAGILDPFYMAEDEGDKLSLIITVIDIFCGGLTGTQTTVLSPIVKDVMANDNPSLQKVVEELRESTKEEARNLGTKLDLIRRMQYAKLCFAPGNKARSSVNISSGLTVITFPGMNLPKTEAEAQETAGRLASGVLYLLTDFIRRVMDRDESQGPKTLIIDEAWAILATRSGASIVEAVALLGRSKNLALVLITQNNSHLKNLDIDNTITTRFAFQASEKEAKQTVIDMRLPPNQGIEETISGLTTGECLMQDFLGRYSTVQISTWRKDWQAAFNSNPYEKMLKKAKNKK